MTNPFKPEKSDKKSSWKSLAGNLFGIEFDDQNSLDDLDLDSVADAVEELNSPQEHHDHDCARDHDHDSDEFDFDFEAPEVADSPSLAKPQQPAAPTSEKSASASSKKEKSAQTTTPSKSSDRSLYEDEDLFGFGIMVDSLNEDTEDFEDDSDDSSAEVSAFVEPEDQEPISEVSQASEKSEPSLEEFDFDFDFEEDDEPAPAQKPQRERQTPKAVAPAPAPAAENAKPPVADQPKAAAEEDDFWSSLEEWDWSKDSGNKPAGKKPRRGRREQEFDEDLEQQLEETPAEESAEAAEEMTEEEAPRKRPRRRRRRSRSRETISAEDGSHEDTVQKAAPEIDPEDIDRLWSSDDEVVTDEVVAKAEPAEPKRITRGEREDGDRRRRGRGRRGSSSSESVKEDKAEKAISPPAEEPESGEYEMVDDLGDENTRKYKNVPTWTEAIGMIVRRRDPSGNPRQRRDSSRGDDRRSGSGQPRRKPRRREE